MTDVLVLDGHHRTALTILRSLGKRDDITLTVAGTDRYLPGLLSRYADDWFLHEPLGDDPKQFVSQLSRHIDATGYDAVMPISDPTSVVCSRYKSKLSKTGVAIGVEDWETFEQTYDKALTAELADSVGVPAPDTYVPTSVEDPTDFPELSFPRVVKPRSKSLWTDDGGISLNLVTDDNYVQSPEALLEMFRSLSEQTDNPNQLPLLQEYIGGEIRDTSLLAADGEIIDYMQNRRVRTQPRSGGGYTLVESLHSQEMLSHVERLVEALEWTGPINFEFMYDGDTHYLLESNGRYWGSLGLALTCGIDILQLHYQELVGDELDHPHTTGSYPEGVQQRWLVPGDFLWLLETIEEGVWGDLPDFFSSFLGSKHDIPSLRDPLPLFGKVAHLGKSAYEALSAGEDLYTR